MSTIRRNPVVRVERWPARQSPDGKFHADFGMERQDGSRESGAGIGNSPLRSKINREWKLFWRKKE